MLQPPDSEGTHLEGYRKTEIAEISSLVLNDPVVAIVDPSRSGKTEFLAGSSELGISPRRYANRDTIFIDITGTYGDNVPSLAVYRSLKRRLLTYVEKNPNDPDPLILLDEYSVPAYNPVIPNFVHIDKRRVVIIVGGSGLSNKAKIDKIVIPLQNVLGREIPTVEVGVKLLNTTQMWDIILHKMQDEERNLYNNLVSFLRNFPINPLLLLDLIFRTSGDGKLELRTEDGSSYDIDLNSEFSLTGQKAMWKYLREPIGGYIYRVADVIEG